MPDRTILDEPHVVVPDEHGMAYELTRGRFHTLLADYRPSRYETFGQDDPRFARPMHHAMKCRDRLHVGRLIGALPEVLREAQRTAEMLGAMAERGGIRLILRGPV